MRRVLRVLLAGVLLAVPASYGTARAQVPAVLAGPPAVSAGPPAVTAGPPTVTANDIGFTSGRTLRNGSAREAGLVPSAVAAIGKDAAGYVNATPASPVLYPGEVVLAARNGVIVTRQASGFALRYSDDKPTELPRDQWIPMRTDTVFDLASLSKLFTMVATVQQIERGKISLSAPVTKYIPQFGQNGKAAITIRELLTHTSGLEPDLPFYNYPTRAAQEAALYADKPQAPPGTAYIYSDLNMITLQFVLEKVTGTTLDKLVHNGITGPLGMRDTEYNPPASMKRRIAATEYEHVPPAKASRGLVWGQVHDENAWALGGVAGHAGVFSTAHDLAILAQTMLDGGRYGGARILREASERELFTNFNAAFPTNDHGLGFELNQRWYMDAMTSPVTAGHTGYTGTSLVIDPLAHSFVILLTNRVHPTRNTPSTNPARRTVARDLARAVPVRPSRGRTAWFSQMNDNTTATLGLPLPARAARLSFDLWYDTEESDIGALEASPDGKTWTPVPMELRAGRYQWSAPGTFSGFAGRRWARVTAALPSSARWLRWRYSTDPAYQGRGIYVDGVRIGDAAGRVLFDDRRAADAARFVPAGWVRSTN